MSEALASKLSALATSSEASDYGATGIHARHAIELDKILDVTEVFLEAGYILEMLTCLDLRAKEQGLRLCYTFNSLEQVDRHLVHADIPGDLETETFEAPTLTSISGAANWMEREVFEMYGVTFTGHPELERLLLPEDADFFPLRKDFGRIEDAPEETEASDD